MPPEKPRLAATVFGSHRPRNDVPDGSVLPLAASARVLAALFDEPRADRPRAQPLGVKRQHPVKECCFIGHLDQHAVLEPEAVRRLAGDAFALPPQLGQRQFCPLRRLLAFELRQRPEDRHHEPTLGTAGVELLVDRVQRPALPLRQRHQIQHVARGARQTVQLDRDQSVGFARLEGRQGPLKARPVAGGLGRDTGVFLDPGEREAVGLAVGTDAVALRCQRNAVFGLVGRADPGISENVGHASMDAEGAGEGKGRPAKVVHRRIPLAMHRALQELERLHRTISTAARSLAFDIQDVGRLNEIHVAIRQQQELLRIAVPDPTLFADAVRRLSASVREASGVHADWRKMCKSALIEGFGPAQIAAHVLKAKELVLGGYSYLADVRAAIAPSLVNRLVSAVGSVAERHVELHNYIAEQQALLRGPPALAHIPSYELFRSGQSLRVVQGVVSGEPEDPDEAEAEADAIAEDMAGVAAADVDSLLHSRCPDFVGMWEGARKAIRSANPDRVRHFAVSVRELFSNLLHRVAADDVVRGFHGDRADMYHNGRPTRRARILFIWRELAQPNMAEFVNADAKALLELFDVLSSATHVPAASFSPLQLDVLLNRATGALWSILAASQID